MVARKLKGMAAALFVSVAVAGCSSATGYFNPTSSSVGSVELSAPAAQAIAADMATQFAESSGQGRGAVLVKGEGSALAPALDTALRGWGFSPVADAAKESGGGSVTPIAYAVASADNLVLVRITTPWVELTRSYQVSDKGATPVSPVSRMTRAAS